MILIQRSASTETDCEMRFRSHAQKLFKEKHTDCSDPAANMQWADLGPGGVGR